MSDPHARRPAPSSSAPSGGARPKRRRGATDGFPGEPRLWHRRAFLGRLGASALALALPSVGATTAARGALARGLRAGGRGREPLPPLTVGLRSLGGRFAFDPPGLLLEPGAEVHWLNIGDFHTVSAFHPANADLLAGEVPLRIPEEARPFHSGMLGLDAGSHFARRFPVEGVYDYFCQPHYTFGMVGRLVVGAARDGPAVRRPTTELAEAAREALPNVEAILGSPGRAFLWSARLNGVLLLRAAAGGGIEGPTGDPVAAARSVAERAPEDGELVELLGRGEDHDSFLEGLDRLRRLGADASYERVLAITDEARSPLRRAVERAEAPAGA